MNLAINQEIKPKLLLSPVSATAALKFEYVSSFKFVGKKLKQKRLLQFSSVKNAKLEILIYLQSFLFPFFFAYLKASVFEFNKQ